MPAGARLSPSILIGSLPRRHSRKKCDHARPALPTSAGSEPPTAFHDSLGVARSKVCIVALGPVKPSAATSTRRFASASMAGHACANAAAGAKVAAIKIETAAASRLIIGRFFNLFLRLHFARVELVVRRAELAGHRDHSILDHVIAIILREALEHRLHILARTGALRH